MAKLVTVPKIIGMPPGGNSQTDTPMYNSMPAAVLVPGTPTLTPSSQVFKVSNSMAEFKKLLQQNGFNYPNDNGIEVIFQADNFPTDTFSNEYGASFLEKMNDFGAGGVGQLAQFSGQHNSVDVLKQYTEAMKGFTDNKVAQGIANSFEGILDTAGAGIKKLQKGGGLQTVIGNAANAALVGGRMDFPQVWKGSGFSPSYTMTIRLYNPDPSNADATEKYIAGPLAVLLALSLPRTMQEAGGYLYNWPFFCKISCPGIYFLNPCCINSISVIKGGDQQSIAWNQRLSVVDVRIEFASLFNSMVVGNGENDNRDRPNMKGYLNALLGQKTLKKMPHGSLDEASGPELPPLNAGPPLVQRPVIQPEPSLFNRSEYENNFRMGELLKNTDQASSFKHYAKSIYNASRSAIMNPAATISEAVDIVKHYTNTYEDATVIVGNVRSFDKENILSSIYGVEESIIQFENELSFSDKLEAAKFILGEALELKRQTDNVEAVVLSI